MEMLSYGIWCLCVIALTAAAPSPKRQGVDIEKTVAQVEEVLRQNANLPRLSRDDILQLLNDIRAEDERSASVSVERASAELSASNESLIESEERERERVELNEISDEADLKRDLFAAASSPPQATSPKPPRQGSLMVVLPYTPRDGATLQELYTRPPRVALLHAPSPMRLSNAQLADGVREESQDAPTVPETADPLNNNNSVQAIIVAEQPIDSSAASSPASLDANSTSAVIHKTGKDDIKEGAPLVQIPVEYPDVSSDLREFLQLHGLHGNPSAPDDHFLLPLDGFKPLPPLGQVDGSVELPEKILLTYDLISPPPEDIFSGPANLDVGSIDLPPDTHVYEPLRPELPFELDTLSSERKETIVPLETPSKAAEAVAPKYRPIDYDSVKVVPLETGPDPLAYDPEQDYADVQKRQSENSTTESPASTTGAESAEATTLSADASDNTTAAPARDSASADSGASGPSIADLESSFGAPAPEDPSEAQLPPPRKNGFYFMLDWNSFLEVGDGDEKVNIRFEPKLGDPQMFLPVSVP